MAQGRRSARIAATMAVLMGTAVLGLAGPAAAVATERADTLGQAQDDTAVGTKQVIKERLHAASDQDWFRYVITQRTRAVVTLGSLPANFNLAVYRADGSRVARSDHARKGFERIYFTATPGTYYVRVASTKGSSSARYRLWLRTLSAPLALQSYSVAAVNSGYPFIVAEFVNTTGKWLRVHDILVNSIAADGRQIHRDALALQQGFVAPYGLMHVASSTGLPKPAGHDHYQVTAVSLLADPGNVSDLKPKPGRIVTEDGYRVHTGTVTNTGTTTRGGDNDSPIPAVDVAYYNANGTIIGTALTGITEVAPGQSVGYRARAQQSPYWQSPFPTPNRFTTKVVLNW
jgi:hypothetical protein